MMMLELFLQAFYGDDYPGLQRFTVLVWTYEMDQPGIVFPFLEGLRDHRSGFCQLTKFDVHGLYSKVHSARPSSHFAVSLGCVKRTKSRCEYSARHNNCGISRFLRQ